MNKETKALLKMVEGVYSVLNVFPTSNAPIINGVDAVYYNVDCGTHDSIYGGTKSLDGGII